MTRPRLLLFGLGLFLLSAVGAGFYLYQNLPELMRLQAQDYLQQYGVDEIEFDGLRATRSDLRVDKLVLRGTYENYTYQASVVSGEMAYSWRALFGGDIASLLLSSLDISVIQTGTTGSQNPQALIVESLLPHQLIAKLPLRSLRVVHLNVDYRSPKFQTVTGSGSLQFDRHLEIQMQTTLAGRKIMAGLRSDLDSGDLDLDIALRENQSDIATLSAHLARATNDDWAWDLQGQAEYGQLLFWLRELDTRPDLELGVPAAKDLTLLGEIAFTARLQHPDKLDFSVAPGSNETPLRQLQASFHFTNEIHQLDIRAIADGVNTILELDGTVESGQFETTLQPFNVMGNLSIQQLSMPQYWLDWMGWEDTVPVHMEAPEAVNISSGNSGSWSAQTQNILLSLGVNDTLLSLQKLNLDAAVSDSDQVRAETHLSAVLNARLHKQTLPSLEITFTQQGSIEQSEFSLRVADAAQSMHADLNGSINLVSGGGEYQLNALIEDLPQFTNTATPLLRRFELLQDTVQIRSGAIRIDTALESKTFDVTDWQQRSKITLENVAGSINEYRFEGLELGAEWSGTSRWKTLQPLEISLAKINLGFEVKDIYLRTSLPKTTPIALPQVRIDAFSASMFGGELILPEAQAWDFGAASNQVTLKAQSWQLAELVALQQSADIEAQGALEGELPLTIADGRVIIEKGYLRALPPGGSIQYKADDESRELAKSSPELALALDLLGDFQFQVLNSEVQLDKAGNLLLGLSLTGSNPGEYEGQPINFNINLEQNLDPLLQSLRLSDNLVEKIEDELK